MRTVRLTAGLALGLLGCAPALAQKVTCDAGVCRASLSAAQLLKSAEALIAERRFTEAAPLLQALSHAPQFTMERQFLMGYAAVESGQFEDAAKWFRAALVNHPDQTRIRLELARTLMLQGKTQAADHHFRLVQGDSKLPRDLLQQIRSTRSVLRDSREFSFNVDFGLAPDSNITNGTNAETVDASFGNLVIPLTLDEAARRKSGLGQTAAIGGSARLDLGETTRLLLDGNSQIINYGGKSYDDIAVQLAAGPEFELNDDLRVSLQATGNQRWYGGKRAMTGGGARAGMQLTIDDDQRLGMTIDVSRNDSGFAKAYSGWQFGAYATYERVVGKSLIGAATLFARRESLQSASYSSTEVGANLGLGGELPLGISASLSAGVSRALSAAPIALFGADPRSDWRFNGRATLGLRSLRMWGFSPSVSYSFSKTSSSLPLYDSSRHKLRFGFARYF